ncbi:MAG: glycosyltransferase [Alphaproteobacteria bacterium]|nr:glycosyltransferase [Alphaproteobacteria bacterium]
MHSLFFDVGWFLAALSVAGTGYAFLSAILVGRFMQEGPGTAAASPAVTILKPLHQGEPDLFRNLETFFAQDYAGAVQILFGVHDEADPAIEIVRALQAKYPPKWLAQVTAALARPGVGIVTCLYTGEPAKDGHKLWSSLAAMGVSYTFLPNAVLGTSLGLAAPCFGSTIALRRQTLDEVGGFAAFADQLADDYEMGRAVRARGYTLAIPAMGVGHTAAEDSAGELFRHELRWSRTIRMVNPAGHVGSFVTHGFAFGLMSALFLDFNAVSLAVVGLALAARLLLKARIDGHFGTYAGPYWLLPLRDLLSFAVFVASLYGETVHWRGTHFAVEPSGAMSQV